MLSSQGQAAAYRLSKAVLTNSRIWGLKVNLFDMEGDHRGQSSHCALQTPKKASCASLTDNVEHWSSTPGASENEGCENPDT
jgi:hypothetical protein